MEKQPPLRYKQSGGRRIRVQRRVEASPNDLNFTWGLAVVLRDQHKYSESTGAYTPAIKAQLGYAVLFSGRARFYEQLGD